MSLDKKKVFLHLSDIHFMKDVSGESNYDLDAALRHALEQDVQKLSGTLGIVDGILVSGDIAFGGKVEEYETARAWLRKLSEILGCDPGFVWCVPGNHDIDQSVHKEFPTLFDTYDTLRRSTKLDEDLRQRLDNDTSGPMMFQPLKNYNLEFSARYNCPTTCRKPWWESDIPFTDGYMLRLRGLNSAIISSNKDKKDVGKLIVGSAQTSYKPEDHLIYITLCHHPPDWLVDGDDVHEAMTAQSHLQLLGHKHSHRHEKINDTVRLYSGAVHPVRSEKPWEPQFYFLELSVCISGDSPELVIKLYPRVWSKTARAFERKAGDFEGLFIEERIKLPKLRNEPSVTAAAPPATEVSMEMALSKKKFSYRFMTLPYLTQISIMKKFGLATDSEIDSIPDIELFVSCFQRATERGVLDKVWGAVEDAEKKTEA